MEQNQTHRIEIEIAALVLRYAHTRIVRPKALTMMTGSLERFGQLTPVPAVVEDRLFVLIDGYLRVWSLKRLGGDTVMADVCRNGEIQAHNENLVLPPALHDLTPFLKLHIQPAGYGLHAFQGTRPFDSLGSTGATSYFVGLFALTDGACSLTRSICL